MGAVVGKREGGGSGLVLARIQCRSAAVWSAECGGERGGAAERTARFIASSSRLCLSSCSSVGKTRIATTCHRVGAKRIFFVCKLPLWCTSSCVPPSRVVNVSRTSLVLLCARRKMAARESRTTAVP